MIDRDRLTSGIDPRVIFVIYALGAVGSVAITFPGLPLGTLLGSLFAVAATTSGRLRVFGAPPAVPQP